MPPSTPDPRQPDGNPPQRDYETEVRLARAKADHNRRAARTTHDVAVLKAAAVLADTLAEIDAAEQAQIDNAKRRHGRND